MNEIEFKKWMEELELLDAPQFQEALMKLSLVAMRAYSAGDAKDSAWKKASDLLAKAEQAVNARLGN